MQVAEWFNTQNLKPDERVATFSTCSYPLNTVSNNWQLDGGYIQGVTNMDSYYKYWITLTTSNSVEAILKVLNETNTRYAVFPPDAAVPSTYENQTFFQREEVNGFSVYKLKDEYPLRFIKVEGGDASVSYNYSNPDEIQLSVSECSENIALIIKMNYYPGWVLHSSASGVSLGASIDGFMKIEFIGVEKADLVLQYGSNLVDQIAFGVTIIGTVMYLIVFVTFFRSLRGGTRNQHGNIEGQRISSEVSHVRWRTV